ncbi:HAD-like domain-containing protein [Syncephalis pseudoplumigaleata]|uniref:HAD-like domain-containing protein n=1 Tax=Syncephalis pseudoplumigaleata TaxID=1712513 RepID=A0A4P9YY36_9FUNG|nr:HAD-like domain-containing protein [Syncephalis pseudoplumigaleata]|eukprot:RKP25006.1 HAD-like domain-containing protein [Syncephalis pseudoplumigaleata]
MGTLFYPRISIGQQYQRQWPVYGRPAVTASADGRASPTRSFRGSVYDWWRQVVLDTFYEAGTPRRALQPVQDRLFDDLWHDFGRARHYALYPDTLTTLQALQAWPSASASPVLGILSNVDARIHVALRALGIADYFHFVLCSEELGYEKPDRRAFEAALMRAHIDDPRDALHVGDDYRRLP